MLRAVADTHTMIWYLYGDARLSPRARKFMDTAAADGDQIAFSSISLIEAIYLAEKGRVRAETLERLLEVLAQEDALIAEVPVDSGIAQALQQVSRDQIPDMPDRIIAATALQLALPLISRDGKIRLSQINTIW